MFAATDTAHAPRHVVISDDKRRAQLNCIAHLLNQIPYQELPRQEIVLLDPDTTGAFDDRATLASRNFVPERF